MLYVQTLGDDAACESRSFVIFFHVFLLKFMFKVFDAEFRCAVGGKGISLVFRL